VYGRDARRHDKDETAVLDMTRFVVEIRSEPEGLAFWPPPHVLALLGSSIFAGEI